MLTYILAGAALVVVLFLVVVALQPTDFCISRTASIAAPPAVVFEHINDFHLWNEWSPWAKLDPEARNTFEGPPAGVGASFAWAGNNRVGAGRMTITESRPYELVLMKLEFFKPFVAVNTTEFKIQPESDGARVTWSMSGKNSFIAKGMVLLMNCDKMVGGQFEQGFANMKSIVETAPVA